MEAREQQDPFEKERYDALENQEVSPDMDWGDLELEEKPLPQIDIASKDYQFKNLNQLDTYELEQHKKAMDKDFNKNALKPGDSGFVYDKVVDFSKGGEVEEEWD
uniref:Centrosomal protein of 19 kDa n=1 Tax=Strombidium inclinatum TaxID=197538 RepID=A0A7S3N383_9SPIT|mmetsp:Transcript_6156/g.9909  ORF Transcript_6156/g.9909 Transcript_6156/m.9909 type:complete len:105 (+) Transcript_6156:1959-2273(+)